MSWTRAARAAPLRALLAAALPLAPGGSDPAVERTGWGIEEFDRRIDQLLASGDYVLVTRDTMLAQDDAVHTTLLVLDATLIVEGTVAGDLVAIGANVYLRPSASALRDVINLAGGLYRSELARIDGFLYDRPLAPYRVTRLPDRIRIEGIVRQPRWVPHGLSGVLPPTYDRVDALTLRFGATYNLRRRPTLRRQMVGRIDYRTARDEVGGALELVEGRGGTALTLGAARETATNERWIQGDLANSLTFLFAGRDYRDYHDVDRLYASATHEFDAGRFHAGLALNAGLERARSLPAADPWTLFGDQPRPNPPVDDGVIASTLARAAAARVGGSSVLGVATEVELAGGPVRSDLTFGRFLLAGGWFLEALADHTLEMRWRFQGPLPRTRVLPRQRWTFVGGPGTLPTFRLGEFQGDRLVFVDSRYAIPMPDYLTLPLLGTFDLELLHAIGMAWTADEPRDLEQNVGVRLRFLLVAFRLSADPARTPRRLDFGVDLVSPLRRQQPGFDTRARPR